MFQIFAAAPGRELQSFGDLFAVCLSTLGVNKADDPVFKLQELPVLFPGCRAVMTIVACLSIAFALMAPLAGRSFSGAGFSCHLVVRLVD